MKYSYERNRTQGKINSSTLLFIIANRTLLNTPIAKVVLLEYMDVRGPSVRALVHEFVRIKVGLVCILSCIGLTFIDLHSCLVEILSDAISEIVGVIEALSFKY